LLISLSCLLALAACGTISHERLLYRASGIQVGIVTDISTDEQATPPVKNRHPASLTPQEIRTLLGSLEVSGWSGTLVGLLNTPQPKPVFTWAELVELAEPLAAAFHEATPSQRVYFSIQNPAAPYDSDRTSGSLFFRDDYLHMVLTDHYSFLQADPGGGEKRDPRDVKGMKLWMAGPAQAAIISEEKQPHWNAFERVHISLNPLELLAGQKIPHVAPGSVRPQVTQPVAELPAIRADASATHATESVNALRLQIGELKNANLDLRSQLKEQSDTIEKLQAEFEKLRKERNAGDSKPSLGLKPSRK
jgi:FtsZ-binding cell division protein ZapB